MSRQLTYRIVISSRSNGILVERQLEMGCEKWKTVDRYNTHDLTAEIKRTDPWIAEVLALCSQPTAAIQIAIPRVPPLAPNVLERLERYEREARELEMQAQNDAEYHISKEIPIIIPRERPLAATLLENDVIKYRSAADFNKILEGSWET